VPEEENNKRLIPPEGIDIPPHETLKIQEKAQKYVKRAQLLYRDLSHRVDDPAAAEEYKRGRERQAYILKTGSWMDEGASERIVEEYPPLVRHLKSLLEDLRR